MPTFAMTLSGAAVVNGTKSFTVSDPDIQQLIDYMAVKYGSPGAPLSPAQALVAWANGMVQQTIAEIKRAKATEAANAINIPPIVFT